MAYKNRSAQRELSQSSCDQSVEMGDESRSDKDFFKDGLFGRVWECT